jgi:hypothetical protein
MRGQQEHPPRTTMWPDLNAYFESRMVLPVPQPRGAIASDF